MSKIPKDKLSRKAIDLLRRAGWSEGRSIDTSEQKLDFETEAENAEKALEEWELTGRTTRRCLRCGGQFIFEVTPSSYKIQCERENCFRLTSRGI